MTYESGILSKELTEKMIDIFTKGITKIFGSKYEKDIKEVMPYVEQVKQEYANLANLTDEEIRGKTKDLRSQIDNELKNTDDQISDLHLQIEDNPDLDINQKEEVFNQIDKLEEERNEELEKVLMEALPMAFAIVKETARRFKENGSLKVQATMLDRQLASDRDNVEIDGDYAIWHNQWMAAGSLIKWEMLHYDVQLIGGIVLHKGRDTEKATG